MKIFTRSMNLLLALMLVIGALAFTPTTPAHALNIDICPDGCDHNNLADALATANDGDTIYISADTFTLTGDVTVNDSITIIGTHRDTTIISGGDSFNITIAAGKTVTLKDLTVTDGFRNGNGGAIQNNGTLTLQNVVIKDSATPSLGGHRGGGIFNTGSLTTSNVLIQGNQGAHGGGIHNAAAASLDLSNTQIINNIASASNGVGGGIRIEANSGSIVFDNVVLNGNQATAGGGIYTDSSFVMSNSAVVNNTATAGSGGGIGAYDFFGIFTFENVTISGNKAENSGAKGGGIIVGGDANLNNVTIVNNTSDDNGGGIQIEVGYKIKIGNTILANNTSNSTANDNCGNNHPDAGIDSLGYNLFGDLGGPSSGGCSGARLIGDTGSNITGQDPKLDALEYLGTTYVHYPQYDSPVIDAGDNATCETTDQIGDPRPTGPNCDIGAAEFIGNGMVMNNSGDPNVPGSLPWTYEHSFGNITFHPSLAGQTITLTAPITFVDTTMIDGYSLYPNTPVTISGGGSTRLFEVNNGVYATLTNLNIQNGYTATDGGAIHNSGTLYLDTIQFSNNTAVGKGGAIYNEGGGMLVLGGNTFMNNSAEDGGAIYAVNMPTISIEASTFTGNTATYFGSALRALNSEATISDSSFTNNSIAITPNDNGGAIAMEGGDLHVTRSTFANNASVNGSGAAVRLNNNNADFTDTIFDGNQAAWGGAIAAEKSTGAMSVTVNRSLFKNNHANHPTFYAWGGAIYTFGADLDVHNSTFSGNIATAFSNWAVGGGIAHTGAGNLFVNNSTFSGNTLVDNSPSNNLTTIEGGAIYADSGGTVEILNSILANSIGGSDCYNTGDSSAPTNSLIETNGIDKSCGTPASTADPKLGPLTNNGGYTHTFRLLPGSPALDAGNPVTCEATDQRGISRPQDGDLNGTSICDIGAYESNPQLFVSAGAQDGWVLEAGENGSIGGKINKGGKTINIGDDAANQQYVGILSFNTAGIPVNAVIQSAVLKFKDAGKTGTLPFGTHGQLLVDIRKGPFSNNAALQLGDFNAKGTKNNLFSVSKTTVQKWYSKAFAASQLKFINKTGVTQFRLRFKLDDNNDLGADFLKIHSGNSGAANRPQLIIEYYVP